MSIQKLRSGFIWPFWFILLVSFLTLSFPTPFSSTARAQEFVDAGTINYDGNTYTNTGDPRDRDASITPGPGVSYFLRAGEGICVDYIAVSTTEIASPPATGVAGQHWSRDLSSNPQPGNPCTQSSTSITVATDNISVPPFEGDIGGGGDDVTEEETTLPTCEDSGGSFGWAMCPMAELLLNAIQGMANFLDTLLQVQPLQTDGAIYTVWGNIRNMALGLFVIAVLIVLFGQSLSVDAYTVKRMAPRLGVAAIGIMLSFYIAAFLIDIFNVLGQGMFRLILSSLGDFSLAITTGAEAFLGGVLVAGGVITLVSIGAYAFFIMLLVPILMAMISGLIVIIARQVILVLLVIVAPFAIASWVLPNTDQWFKRWWGLFTTLLMMYPLVMILLGAGVLFSVVVTNGEATITESNFWNQVIGLAALGFTVGLIPFTIRASSSLLGRIASTVNDPNRGPMDRLRKSGQARGDFRRDARRQNKLSKLGQLDRDGKPEGWRRATTGLQKGWLRATTGTFGYGLQSGKYGGTQRQEAIADARTTDQRRVIASAKADEDIYKLEAFQFRDELAKMQTEIDPDEMGEKLKDIYLSPQTNDSKRRVVYETMVNRKDKELGDIYDTVAKTDAAGGRELLGKLTQDNFGKLFEFAPQWALSDLSQGASYTPNWEFAAGAKPEGLQAMKDYSIRGTLEHFGKIISDPSATDQVRKEATEKIEATLASYANTRPEQRDPKVLNTIQTIINDNKIPTKTKDLSGNEISHAVAISDTVKETVRSSLFPSSASSASSTSSPTPTSVTPTSTSSTQQPQPRPENISPGGVILPDRNDPNARYGPEDLPPPPS